MSIPGVENEVSKASAEMSIPSQYDNVDWGAKTKLKNKKVSHKDTSTGVCYGSKAIMTKESTKLTFKEHLLAEGEDISLLPDKVMGELRGNVRKGANDLEQKWKNALELVHKAYQVASVQRPVPTQKGAWKQYEELISYAVKALVQSRGLDGNWRVSQMLVKEAASDLPKRRFFVEIPGAQAIEVEGDSLDNIVDAITNKILRSAEVRGTKVRVEERTKTHCVLAVWVQDVKRERLIIKQV